MNKSSAYAVLAAGAWVGRFRTYLDSKPQFVCDARGEPIRYRTAEQAEIAAWRALFARLERIEAVHLDPGQMKVPPKPKSKAGKWARVEALFKERAQA